jgi:hypothetical protein
MVGDSLGDRADAHLNVTVASPPPSNGEPPISPLQFYDGPAVVVTAILVVVAAVVLLRRRGGKTPAEPAKPDVDDPPASP